MFRDRERESTLSHRDLNTRRQRLIQDFKAAGGTVDQIYAIKDLLSSRGADTSVLIYFNSRLIPIMTVAHEVAQSSRSKTIILDGMQLLLPFCGAVLALGSSGLFNQYQAEVVFLMGILSALTGVSHAWERLSQPALEWYNARIIFSTLSREISLWASRLNGYTGMSDKDALKMLQQRCEKCIATSEASIQEQLLSLIDEGKEEK